MKESFVLLITLISVAFAIQCEYPYFEVSIRKIYGYRSMDDSFEVFLGSEETGKLLFSAHGTTDSEVFDSSFCSTVGFHTIVMKDASGDGWGSENSEAPLYVYLSSFLLLKANMPYKGGYDYKKDYAEFTITSLITESTFWRYIDKSQTSSEWTSPSFSDQDWNYNSKFPETTSITRYYRHILDLSNYPHLTTLDIQIDTTASLILYVDSVELHRYNLPSGTITPTTSSLIPRTSTLLPIHVNIPKYLLVSKTSITIAIEIHEYQNELNQVDDFSMYAFPYSTESNTCMMSSLYGGEYSCVPDGTSKKGMCKEMLDFSLNTYLFLYRNDTLDFTYTFFNSSRKWLNSYSIGSATYDTYGNPISWTLYGTNLLDSELENPYNPQQWTPLDKKYNDNIWSNGQYKQYPLSSNKQPFNKYWLHIDKGTKSGRVSIAEFQMYVCDTETIPSSIIKYDTDSIHAYALDSPIKLTPISNGYYNYTISPNLPSNVTIHSGTGIISGYPYTGTHDNYTVSAMSMFTQETVSTILNVNIESCDQPGYQSIHINKYSSSKDSQDAFSIYSSFNTLLYQSQTFISSGTFSVDLCLATDIIRFRLTNPSSTWVKGNYIQISFNSEIDVYPIYELSLLKKYFDDYYVNTHYIIPIYSNDWKLSQIEPSSNWYTNTFDDSNWTSLYTNHKLNPIQNTNTHWYLRHSFTISNTSNYTSFYLRLQVNYQYTIYLNNKLYYSSSIYDTKQQDYTTMEWVTISGPLNLLSIGSNQLAIMLLNYEQSNMTTVNFNSLFKLSVGSNQGAALYKGNFKGSTATSSLALLHDINYDNDFSVQVTANSTYTITIDYGRFHSEFINKYCFVSSVATSAASDPSDWLIQASNDDETYTALHIVDNAYFSKRLQKRCFYIPLSDKPWRYYRISISENSRPQQTPYKYAASELFLLSDDLTQLNPPKLSFNVNSLTTYINIPFKDLIPNSDLYSSFSISPSLPSPLELDSTTGTIRGNPTSTYSGQFTISAIAPNGIFSTATISIEIKECLLPNTIFTVLLEAGYYADDIGFVLSKDNTIIDSVSSISAYVDNNFPYCLPQDIYTITFFDRNGDGWETGTYKVSTADGINILSGTVATGEYNRTFSINIGTTVSYYTQQWRIQNTPALIESNWNTFSFDDSQWEVATSTQFIPNVDITSYYRTTFVPPTLSNYVSFIIQCKVFDGVIVYLNGVEVLRHNLPAGIISQSTKASSHITMTTYPQVAFNVNTTLLIHSTNVIAFEYHVGQYIHPEIPDLYVYFVPNHSYRIQNVEKIGDIMNYPDYSYLYDNNLDTYSLSGPRCEDAYYGIQYKSNGTDIISGYSITTGPDCNVRHPSEFVLEASQNNADWYTLHFAQNQLFTKYRETRSYSFYNIIPYKYYRFHARKCENKQLSETEEQSCYTFQGKVHGFQLSELGLYTDEVQKSCEATEDGYSAAMNGQYAFKPCEYLYYGEYKRLCTNGNLGPETHSCVYTAPRSITWDQSVYSYTIDDTIAIHPSLVAVEVNCTMFPELPSFLSFSHSNAYIDGIAQSQLNATTYTVYCANSKGFVKGSFIIEIKNKEPLPIWVYAVFGTFGGLVLIIIILFIVYRLKSHKYRPRKSSSKIGSTKTKTSHSSKGKERNEIKQSRV